jgi:hypothetical protein
MEGKQQKDSTPGTREERIRQALEAYRNGEGSIAFAACQAGISLREMIPLAYSYGLEPKAQDFETRDPCLL